jgi:predicted O-methyltransferase YrrM
LSNIRQFGLYNITSYPFDFGKIDISKLIPNKLDFVFVDAQKNQYASYLEKVENITNKDTFMVIDDVIKYHSKLDTLYGYLEKKQINYKIVEMEPGD